MSNDLVLACYNVSRTYQDGKLKVDVIQSLDLEVKPGESVSIVGASGSGKSTLAYTALRYGKRKAAQYEMRTKNNEPAEHRCFNGFE